MYSSASAGISIPALTEPLKSLFSLIVRCTLGTGFHPIRLDRWLEYYVIILFSHYPWPSHEPSTMFSQLNQIPNSSDN